GDDVSAVPCDFFRVAWRPLAASKSADLYGSDRRTVKIQKLEIPKIDAVMGGVRNGLPRHGVGRRREGSNALEYGAFYRRPVYRNDVAEVDAGLKRLEVHLVGAGQWVWI